MTTYEVRKWTLVLDHPDSTEAQKAEARQHLGMSDPPKPEPPILPYLPELDEVVESYWSVRKRELEERDPIAESVYHAITRVLLLGGSTQPEENHAAAARLLPVFRLCRSAWMRERVGTALFSLVRHHREDLDADTARSIEDALRADFSALPLELQQRIEAAA